MIGLDGRKMSKSYNNTIMLFEPEKSMKKKVMSIVTDSKGLNDPKDPKACSIFALHELFNPEGIEELRARYIAGSIGYGDSKKLLFEKMMEKLGPVRSSWEKLHKRFDEVEDIYRDGASRARALAQETVADCRRATGMAMG